MSRREDRPLREQLVDARAKIEAQLHQLYCRDSVAWPPDLDSEIAELQNELREINALLNGSDEPAP